ncbi:mucin-22-like isoform X2 [Littorina saxatilis]|uniref:mucin-22-like isoform X2 n=1 Tax=Littorina saxatilis TaxID=31220 RepID=UPI0038B547F3
MTLPFTRLSSNQRSFFVVTASEDNTAVVIRKPAGVDVDLSSTSVSSQSTGDGRLVTTTLNKLQTVSTIHDGDLTGLDIRSDKPLALSFGLNRNMMTGGCCRDHMWVQLPGVQVWGKEYVTFPTTAMGPSSTDVYYLAAAENDTVVYVDCDQRLTLSDAYEWTNTTLDTASFHYLVSDKPVVVIKAVRGTRYVLHPCMLTLTDTSRWTTAMTFALPTKALWDRASLKFTVTIITEEAQTDSLTINGEHLQSNWKSISAGKSNSSRALVGGELTGLSRGVVYALSSVSGTTRMAAYVTGASKAHGLCYALGGDAPETNGWNPIFTCPETTTYALTTFVNTAYTTKDAGYTETTESTLLRVSTTAGEGTSHTESNSGTYTDLSTIWKASTTAKEVTTEVTGVSDSISTTRWDGSTTLGQVTTSSSIKNKFTVGKQPATENGRTKPTLDFETTNRELQTESTQNSKITSEDTTVREGIKGTTLEENLTIRTETPKETLMTTTDNTITSQVFKSTATDTTSTTSAARTTPTKRPPTTKPSQPPKPAQRIQPCYCKQNTPRSSSPKTPAQEEEEEAAVVAVVEELKVNLTVARGNTSASVRKVSSAPDERSSSFAMGAFAIVSLSLVLAVVLSFDCIRVVQWVHAKKTASRSMKQQSA